MNIDVLLSHVSFRFIQELDRPVLRYDVFEAVPCVQLLSSVKIDRRVIAFLSRIHFVKEEHFVDILLAYRHFWSIFSFVKNDWNWVLMKRHQLFPTTHTDVKNQPFWSFQVPDVRVNDNLSSESWSGIDFQGCIVWNGFILKLYRRICPLLTHFFLILIMKSVKSRNVACKDVTFEDASDVEVGLVVCWNEHVGCFIFIVPKAYELRAFCLWENVS